MGNSELLTHQIDAQVNIRSLKQVMKMKTYTLDIERAWNHQIVAKENEGGEIMH